MNTKMPYEFRVKIYPDTKTFIPPEESINQFARFISPYIQNDLKIKRNTEKDK